MAEQAASNITTTRPVHIADAWRTWVRSHAAAIALAFIILLGAGFRLVGVNWDDFQHLHPDERFITSVESNLRLPGTANIDGTLPAGCAQWGGYFDTTCSPLNPYNRGYSSFVYGDFPLILVKVVGDLLQQGAFDRIFIVGRYMSALFDLLTVPLAFFIARRLYGKRVGLLAALLTAATVLAIQHAHFFTMDAFANAPLLAAFWFTLDIAEHGRCKSFILAGLLFGMMLAIRVTLVPFIGIIGLAALQYLVQRPRDLALTTAPEALTQRRAFKMGSVSIAIEARPRAGGETVKQIVKVAVGLGIAALAMLIAFRVLQPYAFKSLGLNPQFLADMNQARNTAAGQVDMPPMDQWTARPAYWFPFVNMVLWGMGPGLGLTGWLGFLLAGIELLRARNWKHLLGFFWVGGMFLYLGGQVTMTDRYFLPLYPFLAIFAAYFMVSLWSWATHFFQKMQKRSPFPSHLVRVGAVAVIVSAVGYTLFWAAAFTSIYTRPVTRVAASQWIFDNVPTGLQLGNEHWDDAVPLRINGKDPYGGMYKGVELQWYNDETPQMRVQAIQWLDQADYVDITSNRLYLSIPRLPLRYPLATQYYQWLFNGQLGFQLVGTFTSRPSFLGITINDDNAEESFTVYDHPKVMIFKKTAAYSHANTEALFNSVDLTNVIHQTPLDYTLSHGAYQLSASDQSADTAGGTWSDIFNPNDWVNRVPVLAWLVLLEVLGIVAFPLTALVFRKFADRGYAFAKAFAILVLGWGAWGLASVHVLPFSRISILLVLLAFVAVSALAFWRQGHELVAYVRSHLTLLATLDLFFLVFFLISSYIRFGNPDLWHPSFGGEKPMDFAYLNAIVKTTWFPAYNPWFAGGYINYYYFGQVISATLVKFIGIVPEVAYNLLLPMFFALTALGALGVAFNLVRAVNGSTAGYKRALIAGLLAAFFLVILGNLGEVGVLGGALMKMGQPLDSSLPGVSGLHALLTGAFAWLVERKPFPIGIGDWYWTATRVIPDTINEFPFFSFLYADLHAHLMALAFTLVALGFAVHTVLLRAQSKWYDLVTAALVLGALGAANTWDYPTYLAVIGAALVVGYIANPPARAVTDDPEPRSPYLPLIVLILAQVLVWVIPASALGLNVMLEVAIYVLVLGFGLVLGWYTLGKEFDPYQMARTIGWRFVVLAALSLLIFYPFFANYGTTYTALDLWKGPRTDWSQYLTIYGVFGFIAATFLVVETVKDRTNGIGRTTLLLNAVLLGVVELVLVRLNLQVFAIVLPLVLLAAWQVLRRDNSPERRFVALLVTAALLLTAMVEVVVLKGDIGRSNTVFKFYLQAWVLFGVAGATGLALVFDRLAFRERSAHSERSARSWYEVEEARGAGPSTTPAQAAGSAQDASLVPNWNALIGPLRVNHAWWGVLGVLIGAGMLYPVMATWAKVNDRYVASSPPGLNGMNYMLGATYGENGHDVPLAPDYQAIQWLRENIPGSPVIAEANTGLYRWGDRISINTGLPTIIGWDWHTKQQYSLLDGALIDRRLADLKTLYNTTDPNQAIQLLAQYHVAYVYVGPLERAVYDANGLLKFGALTTGGQIDKVYDADGVQIYKVVGTMTTAAK